MTNDCFEIKRDPIGISKVYTVNQKDVKRHACTKCQMLVDHNTFTKWII